MKIKKRLHFVTIILVLLTQLTACQFLFGDSKSDQDNNNGEQEENPKPEPSTPIPEVPILNGPFTSTASIYDKAGENNNSTKKGVVRAELNDIEFGYTQTKVELSHSGNLSFNLEGVDLYFDAKNEEKIKVDQLSFSSDIGLFSKHGSINEKAMVLGCHKIESVEAKGKFEPSLTSAYSDIVNNSFITLQTAYQRAVKISNTSSNKVRYFNGLLITAKANMGFNFYTDKSSQIDIEMRDSNIFATHTDVDDEVVSTIEAPKISLSVKNKLLKRPKTERDRLGPKTILKVSMDKVDPNKSTFIYLNLVGNVSRDPFTEDSLITFYNGLDENLEEDDSGIAKDSIIKVEIPAGKLFTEMPIVYSYDGNNFNANATYIGTDSASISIRKIVFSNVEYADNITVWGCDYEPLILNIEDFDFLPTSNRCINGIIYSDSLYPDSVPRPLISIQVDGVDQTRSNVCEYELEGPLTLTIDISKSTNIENIETVILNTGGYFPSLGAFGYTSVTQKTFETDNFDTIWNSKINEDSKIFYEIIATDIDGFDYSYIVYVSITVDENNIVEDECEGNELLGSWRQTFLGFTTSILNFNSDCTGFMRTWSHEKNSSGQQIDGVYAEFIWEDILISGDSYLSISYPEAPVICDYAQGLWVDGENFGAAEESYELTSNSILLNGVEYVESDLVEINNPSPTIPLPPLSSPSRRCTKIN